MTARSREAAANADLTAALIRAATAGVRPRCADAEVAWMFTDESPRTRAVAATYCDGCELLEPCGEVGRYQRFGVWAGRDRTVRLGGKLERDSDAA